MSFKDQIQSDISVFLNVDEFGDTHNINGVDYTVIVDNDLLDEKKVKGVYTGDLLFFIDSLNFTKPVNNTYDQTITFDGSTYKIISVIEEDGISEVVLSSESTGRFITVKYRLKAGTGANKILGIQPTKQEWSIASTITPSPIFEEIKNDFKHDEIGIIKQNSIKLSINKSLFTRAQLESYEFYVNSSVYGIINGQVLETPYYWIMYLAKQN